MAIITRCRCPPESRNGYWWYMSCGSGRPTSVSNSMARPRRDFGVPTPCAAMTSSICAPTVISGLSAESGSWKIIDTTRPRRSAQLLGRHADDVRPVKVDGARGDADHLGQKPHDRIGGDRLARSGLADDAQDLAALEIEGDVLDGMGPFHAFRQVYREVAHRKRHIVGGYRLDACDHRDHLPFQPSGSTCCGPHHRPLSRSASPQRPSSGHLGASRPEAAKDGFCSSWRLPC